MERYVVQKRVGQGAQGTVFRACDSETGGAVAIKKIDVSSLDDKARRAALAEVRVLETLRDDPHPCIMGYKTSFIHDDYLCMVLDWCDGGTLQDLLDGGKEMGTAQSEDFVWHVLISLTSALNHCHSRGILHRDVKLANVFLHREDGAPFPSVRLGDFGVSCVLDDKSRARTVVGTPYYLSPELCCGQPYDARSDIWSLGVALYQLCNDKLPFEAANYAALIMRIVQANATAQITRYSKPLHAIVSRCMKKAPGLRPTALELFKLPGLVDAARRLGLRSLLPFEPNSDATAAPAAQSAGKGPCLPLARRQSLGSVPSRRVRNRAVQNKHVVSHPTPPPPPALPVRPTSSTQRIAPRLAYANPKTRPPSAAPVDSEAATPVMSDRARKRAAQAVAALPTYGSDSDSNSADGDVVDSAHNTVSESSTLRRAEKSVQSEATSPLLTDPLPIVESFIVTWKVDGQEGATVTRGESLLDEPAHNPNVEIPEELDDGSSDDFHVHTGVRDEDRHDEDGDDADAADLRATGASSVTVTNPENAAAQLIEVCDEAERLVPPSAFLALVDALQNETGTGKFDQLLSALEPEIAAELTYLCYRYIFLSGEAKE
jgi:serine/threonine protein kinase